MRVRLQLRSSALAAVAVCCFAFSAEAASPKRRAPVSRPASLDVAADPKVDARVAEEVVKGRQILENLTAENVLASPYVVSAFYYHDGFLDDFPVDRSTAAPERRIVGQISKLLTPEIKARFVGLLHELFARSGSGAPPRSAEPVTWVTTSRRRSHRYAIDLFAPEGSPVNAVSRGLIVLADGGWNPDNLFSTASRKGGNAVILFDPDRERFYRYCHLSTVDVSVGAVAAAGQHLGALGHTGLNASRAGHGRHLHFEVNSYTGGHVRAMEYQQLRALVGTWRAEARPSRTAGAVQPSRARARSQPKK